MGCDVPARRSWSVVIMVLTGRESVMLSREGLENCVSKLKLEVSRQDYDDHSQDNLGIP